MDDFHVTIYYALTSVVLLVACCGSDYAVRYVPPALAYSNWAGGEYPFRPKNLKKSVSMYDTRSTCSLSFVAHSIYDTHLSYPGDCLKLRKKVCGTELTVSFFIPVTQPLG